MDACCSYSQSKAERSSVWRGNTEKKIILANPAKKLDAASSVHTHKHTKNHNNSSKYIHENHKQPHLVIRLLCMDLWQAHRNKTVAQLMCPLRRVHSALHHHIRARIQAGNRQRCPHAEAPESFLASEKNERAALKKRGSCMLPARRLKLKSQPAHPIAAWHHFLEIQGTMGCSLVSWRSEKPSPNSFFLQDQMWMEL